MEQTQRDREAEHAYADAVPHPPTIAERLAQAEEYTANHAEALARVGERLTRAEEAIAILAQQLDIKP